MKTRFLLTMLTMLSILSAHAGDKLYGHIMGNVPGNAAVNTYTWEGTTNNLLTVYEFSAGELANYTTLKFTLSKKSAESGMLRMGYYIDGTFTEFTNPDGNKGYGSAGDKTVDLTAQGIDLSQVTKISFGGRSGSGSVSITNVYLETAGGDQLPATFGSVASSATFYDYTWSATTNNLMTVFEFNAGELATYATLKFTLSNKSADSGMLRMGYYIDGTFTEFTNPDGNKGYGSNGTKTIDLTAQGIDLSQVTKISFGGRSGTGGVNIRDIYVETSGGTGISEVRGKMSEVKDQYYNLNGQRVSANHKGLVIVNGKKMMIK